MAELVANTYSDALFEVALEIEKVDQITEEFDVFVKYFEEYPDFFELFKTPEINKSEKMKIVKEIYKNDFCDEFYNFIYVILDKKRSSEIISIKRAYDKKVDDYKNIVNVTVESAVELDEDRKQALVKKVEDLTKKNVRMTYVVKEDILGGIVIKVGDKIIDGSVQSRLNNMLNDLTQIIMK